MKCREAEVVLPLNKPSSPMLHSRNVIGLFRCEVSWIEILCVKVTPNRDKLIVNIICDIKNCSCARQRDSNAVNSNFYGKWMLYFFPVFIMTSIFLICFFSILFCWSNTKEKATRKQSSNPLMCSFAYIHSSYQLIMHVYTKYCT